MAKHHGTPRRQHLGKDYDRPGEHSGKPPDASIENADDTAFPEDPPQLELPPENATEIEDVDEP
jgi:hypothetical protein